MTCLPIVEAAQLLGFLQGRRRRCGHHSGGTGICRVGDPAAEGAFRKAALEHVLLLRQITRALNNKSDHTVPEEFFLDMLDEQFSDG